MATTATAAISRTGPAIEATLAEFGSSSDAEQFVGELRDALGRAAETLDLSETDIVLDRWHALATMAVNPLSEAEQVQVARARAGDLTGFRARDEYGNWVTL